MTKKQFSTAVDRLDLRKKNKEQAIPGILGFMLNGEQTTEVPTREGFVYVRLRNNTSEVIQAFNEDVSPVYGLPVLVTRDEVNKSMYIIAGRDLGVYLGGGQGGWGISAYLPRHGSTHSRNPNQSGGDLVWVYGNQFMPLLVTPSGSSGGPNVLIDGFTYYQSNLWHYAGGTGSQDIIPTYTPTGGSDARMVLVYLDDDGNPQLEPGTTYFAESITGNSAIIPYLPPLPDTGAIPLGGVRLTTGTSAIVWANLYDLRPLMVSDGFIPTGSNAPYDAEYVTISNQAGLANERAITAGAGIELIDGGANSTITIQVTGSLNGGGGGGGAGTLLIYDDSVFKVTGTAISFDNGLDVAVTGSIAYVNYADIGARVYNSSGTAIDTGSLTALTFDSERYDTDNIHSIVSNTNRLTCNTPGKYAIGGGIEWAADATAGKIRQVQIKLNGTTAIVNQRQMESGDGRVHLLSIQTVYNLLATDYVELYVYQDSGSALVINSVGNHTPEFFMQRIG